MDAATGAIIRRQTEKVQVTSASPHEERHRRRGVRPTCHLRPEQPHH
ncbi:hypothetical protein ACRAWF_39970 [Streptomyces sp. L7]